MNQLAPSTLRALLVSIGLSVLAAACGGGSGGSAVSPASSTPSGTPATGNGAPTISGTPGTSVSVGQSYSFTPAASDSAGNALSFSATKLPSWLTLNSNTGALTGVPAAADVGTYAGIVITVSAGSLSASLATFSITVSQLASGSASLTWTIPTQNADGTALTNLTGFTILYGQAANALNQSVTIDNPSISTYTIDNLSSGTWYFSVVSVSSGGTQSSPTNTASKII